MTVTATKSETRTESLKRRVLEAQYWICVERARYVTEAYRANEGAHPSIRAARAFENTLRNMSIFIQDGQRVVGNYCSRVVGTALSVERGEMSLILDIDIKNLLRREQQPYGIDPADRKELFGEILPYWRGRTVRDMKYEAYRREGLLFGPAHGPLTAYRLARAFGGRQVKNTLSRFVTGGPRELKMSARALSANNPNLINNVFDVQGHLIIGHNNVIETGLKGVHDRALELLPGASEDGRKFLEGVLISCEAARMFAGRFAKLAHGMAAAEPDEERRRELLKVAEISERVPWLPPRGFHEALQFFWFVEVMAVISHGMASISAVGRMDQYLYPFFMRDIESRAMDEAQAVELMGETLILLSNNLIMLPSFGKDTSSELGADSMAPTFGGVGRDGEDATNRLSCLFLDAIRNMRGMSNSYSVRISSKTGPEFMQKISEVHSVTSGLALFNDDVIIPALVDSGCEIEDARDYGIIGCVEPTPQGNTFGCTSGNDVSMAGSLEMAFTGGRVRMVGRRFGPPTGDPRGFSDFETFKSAYRSQLAHSVAHVARCVNEKDKIYAEHFHNPFISMTLDGCVENAKDMTQGGAKYNFASISGRGLATVADSLAAVGKFVFEDGSVTMDELCDALDTNFRGREKLRTMLRSRGPHYGTDNPEADARAREVASMFCEEVMKHRAGVRDAAFRPGFFSYGMHVLDGMMLGATPDGRLAGEPISNSISPTNGLDTGGPTATMCSASKLDHALISNGCSLNMKLMPALLQTDEGRRKFESMLRAYFMMGGMHAQFNVVDNETLRAAQLDPDSYRDLTVRVSGYVAYFTDLGSPLQNELIRRTEIAGF